MADTGPGGEHNIIHHHHRNITDKRKAVSCNVSTLTAEAEFAATLYGLTSSGGHHPHSHDHTNTNTLSGSSHRTSSLVTSEHHPGKSINS